MITTISYNLNLIKINLLFTCKSSLLHVVLILPYLLVTVHPLESIYGGVHSSNAVESKWKLNTNVHTYWNFDKIFQTY